DRHELNLLRDRLTERVRPGRHVHARAQRVARKAAYRVLASRVEALLRWKEAATLIERDRREEAPQSDDHRANPAGAQPAHDRAVGGEAQVLDVRAERPGGPC